jgi:hypothetical protein
MPMFKIEVTRVGYATRVIEIEAANQDDAEGIALATAGNYQFTEHDAAYELTHSPVKVPTPNHQEPRKEALHAQT